jgi:hypothetical protein
MKLVKEGNLLGCVDAAHSNMVEADYLRHKKPMYKSCSMIFSRANNNYTRYKTLFEQGFDKMSEGGKFKEVENR